MITMKSDDLRPTEYLIMEVLAARSRTGESCWTFPRNPAITTALKALENAGYVQQWDLPDGEHWRVFPSAEGIKEFLSDGFRPKIRPEAEQRVREVCARYPHEPLAELVLTALGVIRSEEPPRPRPGPMPRHAEVKERQIRDLTYAKQSFELAISKPETRCASGRCPDTNWGGNDRVHARGTTCPEYDEAEMRDLLRRANAGLALKARGL